MMIEKYIQHPRHIEVQVVADTHGNFVHFHTVDASLQRQGRKIIDEAPANISVGLDKVLGDAAITVAKSVGYVNAGSVEFIME